MKKSIFLALVVGCFLSCQQQSGKENSEKGITGQATEEKVSRMIWGVVEKDSVYLYTLQNREMKVSITNYGGIIVQCFAPDRTGQVKDIVLGFDTLDEYVNGNKPYFGALIGRYANRIAGGRFTLADTVYQLEINNAPNHLHGGPDGFHTVVWESESFTSEAGPGVLLKHTSPDGSGGYPGTVVVTVRYTLTDNHSIRIEYKANTDRTTYLNLTNHSYFNLAGHDAGSVLDHQIKLNANAITPVNQDLIPTGILMEVEGTPFDLREFTPIGQLIDAEHPQLNFAGGFDHNFLVSGKQGTLRQAAEVLEPESGRKMVVYTTEPGIQFYSGNFLNNVNGKSGAVYDYREGFCLEAQHYPDSPNQKTFPSVLLKPEETYEQTTVYQFSIDNATK